MKRFGLLAGLLLLASSLAAPSAQAVTVSISASDPIQLGRLSRNAITQDFAGDEPFPGVINPATPYHFHAYSLNVGLTPYVDVFIDSPSATVFYSGYLGSYHPNNLATNWLGDEGSSGGFFSATDPGFFDVFVGLNNTLVLVVNESITNGGLNMPPVGLFITGYTDAAFSNPVDLTPLLSASATVIPEPSTAALFGVSLVVLGLQVRRRRKAV